MIAGATTGASALLVGALGGDAMTAGNAAANESINNALSHKQATRLTESIQACAGEAQCINDKVYNAILLSNRQGSSIDQSNAQSAVSVLAQLANDPTIPLSDANRAAIATLAGKNDLDYVDWSKTPNLSGQSNASPNSPFSPNWNTGDFSAGLSQGINTTPVTTQFGISGQVGAWMLGGSIEIGVAAPTNLSDVCIYGQACGIVGPQWVLAGSGAVSLGQGTPSTGIQESSGFTWFGGNGLFGSVQGTVNTDGQIQGTRGVAKGGVGVGGGGGAGYAQCQQATLCMEQ